MVSYIIGKIKDWKWIGVFGGLWTVLIATLDFPKCLQVVTVNCARVIHGNQIATNGVVHVIDRVLTQIGTSIQDFIEAEDDLSSFRVSTRADCLGSLKYLLFPCKNLKAIKMPLNKSGRNVANVLPDMKLFYYMRELSSSAVN